MMAIYLVTRLWCDLIKSNKINDCPKNWIFDCDGAFEFEVFIQKQSATIESV